MLRTHIDNLLLRFGSVESKSPDRVKSKNVNRTIRRFDNFKSNVKHNPQLSGYTNSLMENGYAHLGNLGINIDSLSEKTNLLFSNIPQDDPDLNVLSIINHFFVDSATNKFLEHREVNDTVRGYLGEDALFGWSMLFRIPQCSSVSRSSGLWHHDCIGRHLKLFVFLHDVDSGDRTTKYAVGSHRMTHNGRWWGELTRYQPNEVEDQFEIVEFRGRKGDGILFDTNGLHRGTWEANANSRDILKFCYASATKAPHVADHGLMIGIHKEYLPTNIDLDNTLLDQSAIFNTKVKINDGSDRCDEISAFQYGQREKPVDPNPKVDALTGQVLLPQRS